MRIYLVDENDIGYELLWDFIISYNVGLNIKVYKNLNLTLNYDGDLIDNVEISSNDNWIFSQTKSVGVMVSF